MSITPLSAARIAGEVGLAGGTATGGAFAAKYANRVVIVEQEKENAIKSKEGAEDRSAPLGKYRTDMNGQVNSAWSYWEQIKNQYKGSFASDLDNSIQAMYRMMHDAQYAPK